VAHEYALFVKHIEDNDLSEAYSVKPILDGTKLCTALGAISGRWMKPALDMLLQWQFDNPGVKDPQPVLEEIKNAAVELEIKWKDAAAES